MKIGAVTALKMGEDFSISPDSRQELIKTIGGVKVIDYGDVLDGETYGFSVTFLKDDFTTIKDYAFNRQKISFIDEAGIERSNCRVVIKSYKYVNKFPDLIECSLEIWRV